MSVSKLKNSAILEQRKEIRELINLYKGRGWIKTIAHNAGVSRQYVNRWFLSTAANKKIEKEVLILMKEVKESQEEIKDSLTQIINL